MCECPVRNKLSCFITAWTLLDVSDLKHLADVTKKHEESFSFMLRLPKKESHQLPLRLAYYAFVNIE